MAKKANILSRMNITEISLVHKNARPANPGAFALFHKTQKGDDKMTELEKIQKALDDANAKIEELTKAHKEAVEAKDAEIAKLKGDSEGGEEDVLKALDPKARAVIEKMQAENAELAKNLEVHRKATEGLVAKAEIARIEKTVGAFEALGIDVAKFAPIMKKVEAALDEDETAEVYRVLKAADAQIREKSTLVKEIGGEALTPTDDEKALLNKAEEIRKAEPGLTKEAAYAKALEQNPDLAEAAIGPLN